MHPIIQATTQAIIARSQDSRANYLCKIQGMRAANRTALARSSLSASNLAHGYATLGKQEKIAIREQAIPLIAIVSAYNDVLSAHQPMEKYPELLKIALKQAGAIGQFAGGVPAMCDGVTQGRLGMELSLFSRDVIAMSTGIALSHEMYDGMLLLGVCDKIVPGLLLGALSFGHLPAVFVPAGPMPSGLSNEAKADIRKQYAQGQVGESELLDAEMAAYHSAGTCTFYGTANSNQLLLEAMGLMLPGAAFVQPSDPLRTQLTQAAAHHVVKLSERKPAMGIGEMVTAECIVNAVVALLATGGSTNHTMHWVAIARAAGWQLEWADFDALSAVVPLLARVYPNGAADVNDMHAAGGTAYIFDQLLGAGLMHNDVQTVMGKGLKQYTQIPTLNQQALSYVQGPSQTLDAGVLRPANTPFQADGGLRILTGNMGKAVVKVSAVKPAFRTVSAPCAVFESQEAVLAAFKEGALDRNVVVVVRGQGPKACGMPELHKLTPALSVLQDKGFSVALVTDGRMSGASGKVLSAIHVTPEAAQGGVLAKLCDGDWMTVDAVNGVLSVSLTPDDLAHRVDYLPTHQHNAMGREMFGAFRALVNAADLGATVLEV